MAGPSEKKLAILFADVVGSTQLYEALGDDRARETVQQCLAVMRQATEHYGGSVIKTMGDEVMATFPSADDALNAANQMQQRITNTIRIETDDSHVSIRIGCHFGTVVAEERDIAGAAVSTANRMTSQAKAGQILTTSSLVEQLSPQWKALVRQIDVVTPKGQSDEVAVFEVLWQPEEATNMLPSIDPAARPAMSAGRLRLRFRDEEVIVGDKGKAAVTMGRADDNDVVIKGNLISRVHARIDLARNRFVLVDESTNGTFIQQDAGEELYVRRDSTVLTGSGIISMGRVAARGTPLAIEYRVED
ncbi:MAG: adenylate/guanylate cyclase domain-containing protein [Gammaproteobacteria bacterium PRO9]|nr:adenylate/guanylate cyclase domain-containing protein [Gammaproteobacteria bacterium PRO9]